MFDAVQRRGGKGLTQEYTCNYLFLLFCSSLIFSALMGIFQAIQAVGPYPLRQGDVRGNTAEQAGAGMG